MKTQNIVKTKGGKAVIILLAASFSLVGVIALIVLLIEIMNA